MISENYNAADENHVREMANNAKGLRDRELEDVRIILNTTEGRRFYSRYLHICGLFKSSMTGNNTTFFQEGERNIGLKLFTDMNEAAPELYIEMLKEELEERTNFKRPTKK